MLINHHQEQQNLKNSQTQRGQDLIAGSLEAAYSLNWGARMNKLPLTSQQQDLIAGSLEAAYSLNWGAREIWGKGGGETLALL